MVHFYGIGTEEPGWGPITSSLTYFTLIVLKKHCTGCLKTMVRHILFELWQSGRKISVYNWTQFQIIARTARDLLQVGSVKGSVDGKLQKGTY